MYELIDYGGLEVEDAPGGRSFDRLDTKLAKEIRLKIYAFLAGYLDPPSPFKSISDIQESGCRWFPAAYKGKRIFIRLCFGLELILGSL